MKRIFKLACVLLAVTMFFGIFFRIFEEISAKNSPLSENQKESDLPRNEYLKENAFKSDKELMAYVNDNFFQSYLDYNGGFFIEDSAADYSVAESVSPPATESSKSPVDAIKSNGEISETNVQVEGVDEGDIVKTDGEYIYILRENELIIVDARTEETKVLSYYKIFAQGNGQSTQMYIKGDKAIIVGYLTVYETITPDDSTNFGKPANSTSSAVNIASAFANAIKGVDYYSYKNEIACTYTVIYVIDISNKELPRSEREVRVEGSLISSREVDGKIYLVANKNFGYFYYQPYIENIVPTIEDSCYGIWDVPSTEIIKPTTEYPDCNIMTVAVLDYINEAELEMLSFLGTGSNIYMTAENLYIFGYAYQNQRMTTVAKYSISDGISYVASVAVPGYTSTDFSYDEYEGKFRIATTTDNTNNIFVYDSNLKKIGELTELAPTEQIYSARFMGDTAYIVTFRQVDPLFVIDMSKDNPEVLGELKIPGFSTYLHPVGENLLLGIGYETKTETYKDYYGYEWTNTTTIGMKISLFDVSDPKNPTEADVISFTGENYVSATAQDNYKAFTYSAATQTGYFPIDINYHSALGFIAVKINGNKLETNITVPSHCSGHGSYDSRVCFIGENLYLYQYSLLTRFDRTNFEELEVLEIK